MARKLWVLSLIPILALLLSASPPDDRILQRSICNSAVVETVVTDKGKVLGSAFGTATSLGDGYYVSARHMICDIKIKEFYKVFIIDGCGDKHPLTIIDYGLTDKFSDDWCLLYCDSLKDRSGVRISYRLTPSTYIFRCGNDNGEGLVTAMGVLGRIVDGNWSFEMSVRPGSSGGGLYNRNGELIGVMSCSPVHTFGASEFFDVAFGYFVPLQHSMWDRMKDKPLGDR